MTRSCRSAWRHVSTRAADHPILAAIGLLVIVSAFFVAFPGVDIWLSGLFYRDPNGFFLKNVNLLRALRQIGYVGGILVVVWLILQVALKLIRPDRPSYVPPNITFFLLSTLIAAPALLVNVLFKNYWGRPRPRDLDLFGGDLPFVEAWRITDHCATNCSFVSGEASFAFWMTAFALVVPREFRVPVALFTVAYASILSFNRILFGGHFLSDVLISIAITLLIIAVGYRLFITHPPRWLANDQLEAGLTRLGIWLQFGRAKAP